MSEKKRATKANMHRCEQHGMRIRRADSAALAAFGHDKKTGTFWFTFRSRNGIPTGVYGTKALPPHLFATLCRVNSAGRAFNKLIRGKYLLERLF
jgi:hypothetical protein